jgi:beta-carotene 3-hydroxylase
MRFFLILVGSFIAMEFFSYLAHRFIYHGALWFVHRSHHTPRTGLFELNDLFPVVLAAATISLMLYGFAQPAGSDIVAASIGISAYGLLYFTIHDLYVHRRMRSLAFSVPYLKKVKKAHMVHHAFGEEPFGLLVFWLPKGIDLNSIPDEEPV